MEEIERSRKQAQQRLELSLKKKGMQLDAPRAPPPAPSPAPRAAPALRSPAAPPVVPDRAPSLGRAADGAAAETQCGCTATRFLSSEGPLPAKLWIGR
jgi:hypothetical protein